MAKPSLAIGIAKVITFFESANFLLKNLKSDVVKELFNPPFPKGVAKVVTFWELANFFDAFLHTFFAGFCAENNNPLIYTKKAKTAFSADTLSRACANSIKKPSTNGNPGRPGTGRSGAQDRRGCPASPKDNATSCRPPA